MKQSKTHWLYMSLNAPQRLLLHMSWPEQSSWAMGSSTMHDALGSLI